MDSLHGVPADKLALLRQQPLHPRIQHQKQKQLVFLLIHKDRHDLEVYSVSRAESSAIGNQHVRLATNRGYFLILLAEISRLFMKTALMKKQRS